MPFMPTKEPALTTSTSNTNNDEAKLALTLAFDASIRGHQHNVPSEFIWPESDRPSIDIPELAIPPIDMGGFLSGEPVAVAEALRLVGEACRKHGFFLLVNHGVDKQVIATAEEYMDTFFNMPPSVKQRFQRKNGEQSGYASSFIGRFASNLPWKETLSVVYKAGNESNTVYDYLVNVLGEDFLAFGKVYQEYGDAMNKLVLVITELLAVSLGVDRSYFRDFFEDNNSIMRLNNYPPCQKPELVLGTGPHNDPTSLTILHQDQVGGLQVFVDEKWHSISPNAEAFVINIGDTFMAMTNGIYKSCLHRAVVNTEVVRKSIVFFLCTNEEKLVKPPSELVDSDNPRLYPDFRWSDLLEFTMKHYRTDVKTMEAFATWIQQRKE